MGPVLFAPSIFLALGKFFSISSGIHSPRGEKTTCVSVQEQKEHPKPKPNVICYTAYARYSFRTLELKLTEADSAIDRVSCLLDQSPPANLCERNKDQSIGLSKLQTGNLSISHTGVQFKGPNRPVCNYEGNFRLTVASIITQLANWCDLAEPGSHANTRWSIHRLWSVEQVAGKMMSHLHSCLPEYSQKETNIARERKSVPDI